MEKIEIIAHIREPRGKGGARKLRAQGLMPAILYGPKIETTAVTCDSGELMHVLEHGHNVLINLKVKDGKGKKAEPERVVMVRELQVDPVKGVPIHADFYEVSMKEVMTVEVPIHYVGKAEGTKIGGILDQIRREIEVECLPADLPTHIEVDVSPLDIGDSIHVRDITVDKIKILTDPDQTIVTVVPPVVEKEPEPEELPEEMEEAEEAAAEAEKEEEQGEGEGE